MNWLNAVMVAGAVCGVLAEGVTSSPFAAEDGHVKEVIKHAKGGTGTLEQRHCPQVVD